MGASEYSAALWHVRAESWAAYILGSRCHYIDAPLLNGSTALILPATFKEPICAGVRAIGEVARRISRSYGPLVPEGGGRVGVGVVLVRGARSVYYSAVGDSAYLSTGDPDRPSEG